LTDAFVKDFVDETVDFLNNAKSIEPCVAPVILSPEVAGVFAHESFGHKSEADFMIGDETMKKEWTLGKKVGSDILSIYDSGLENGSGYVPYDDEGTKARKNYLIKNGVLCGRLHSAATAADLGEGLTGNARAINCDYEPIVRMTSTIIEGGKLSKEQLFAGIKHGYFIKSYQHGSGMSTFTIAPLLAYEIVDGKIAGPVKIAVITGNVFETLSLIDGVSNDVTVCSSVTGGCGKMEQFPLNVADGGPYVRISKMNIQ
jgi:TldD protein